MKKTKKQAVTLMELVVVVLIIGVLAGIMVPQYIRSRERTIDKQAQAILKVIRAAERNHKLRNGQYWPSVALVAWLVPDINSNLSLDLVDDGEWIYIITGSNGTHFQAQMFRNKGGYNRFWTIQHDTENPTCTPVGSSSCP